MTYTICPHCGKHTDGAVADRKTFLFVVCDECDTILGVLPKYYQKVTWKEKGDSGEPEKDAGADKSSQGASRRPATAPARRPPARK